MLIPIPTEAVLNLLLTTLPNPDSEGTKNFKKAIHQTMSIFPIMDAIEQKLLHMIHCEECRNDEDTLKWYTLVNEIYTTLQTHLQGANHEAKGTSPKKFRIDEDEINKLFQEAGKTKPCERG